MIVTQFLFGAGEAGAYPNVSGVIARWFPKRERARAQGAVWAASRLGGALSPLLVVPLLRTFGWRAVFGSFAVLGVIWAAAWRAWFHDKPADHPGITGAELADIGAEAARAHGSHVWRALVRSRQTWLIVAMYWGYVWGAWFYFSWFPTYLVRGAGFTESEMGLLSSLPFMMGCLGNLGGGVLSDWLAKRYGLKIARCGQGSASLALASLLIFGLAFASDKVLIVILASVGFGVLDFMVPAAWALCLDLGRSHAGVLTGAMNTGGLAGGFVCTVLFGHIVQATGGYRVPLCAIAVMVFSGAVLFAFIDPRRPIWDEA